MLRGAAWALPAVALATAVPATSASEPDPILVTHVATWNPTSRQWSVNVAVTNPGPDAVTVFLQASTFDGASYRSGWSYSAGTFTHTLASGASSAPDGLTFVISAPPSLQPGEPYTVTITTTAPPTYPSAAVPIALSY